MIKILKFEASWCPPCKQITPILEQVKEECPEVEIVKIDVEEDVEATDTYGIRNIPTLVFIKNGEEVTRLSGLRTKEQIIEAINGAE